MPSGVGGFLIWRQRFCDCVANNLFFFLGERKRGKKKDRSGDCAATGSRPPRPPGERARWERYPTETTHTAEKVSVFGRKPFVQPSPLRGRCRRSRRMRCRLRVAEPFTGEKVTLCSVTRCRATPHHRLRAELPLKGEAKDLRDQITQTIYLYHTNRKKPSFSFAPSERYLRSTPAARLSASVIPLP